MAVLAEKGKGKGKIKVNFWSDTYIIAIYSPIWYRMGKRANAGDLNERERRKSDVVVEYHLDVRILSGIRPKNGTRCPVLVQYGEALWESRVKGGVKIPTLVGIFSPHQ